ncbi:MAG: AGE family epimerase/isomerase [Clostridia bacterium]|nr:AGE family epimerase/isomerase [Clostridia bacterium]
MDYKKYLTENVLPFWMDNAMDYENGGIFTCIDKNDKVYDTTKNVWFQGRALWTYAMAYNTIDQNPEYLKVCENLYGFLSKCTDANGRMPFLVRADGTTIVKRDYYYSESFAAIGCAQYYKATGKQEVWESAERYFDICYSLYKDPKTRTPELTQEFEPCKVFGVSMIMLSTAQFMRNVGINTEKYDAAANDAIEEMKNGGYIHDDIKTIIDYVDLDGNLRDTPKGRTLCPGHAYEAAWFILLEGEIKNDDSIRLLGKKILDYAMPEGFEKETSIIPTCRDIHGRPLMILEEGVLRWWPQNEAIIAYALAYNIFKEEKYKKLFAQIQDYAFEHFADKTGREWFGYINYDGTVFEPLKGDKMKGPFHLPRMLMALISLEETGSILQYIS